MLKATYVCVWTVTENTHDPCPKDHSNHVSQRQHPSASW